MSRRPKEATRERVATMLERAIEGSERLNMPDVADRYREMSVEDYADEKGIRLINPITPNKRGRKIMAEATKTDLQNDLEEKDGLLDDIWSQIIASDDGDLDDGEALDAIADILNEHDSDRFPIDDDETEEGEEAEAAH